MPKNLFGTLAGAKDEAAELSGLFGKLKDQMEDFQFDPKDSIRNTKKNFSDLVDIAEKFNKYQHSIAEGGIKNASLSTDQLKLLRKQLKEQASNLSLNQKSIGQRISNLKKEQKELKGQAESTKQSRNQLASIGKEIATNEKLQRQLTDAIQDSNSSIKTLENGLIKAAATSKQLSRNEKILGGMQKAVSMIPFSDWLNPLALIGKLISFIFGAFVEVDALYGKTAKTMNRSIGDMMSMREAMTGVAKSTSTLYDNSRDMLTVFDNFQSVTGLKTDFRDMTKSQKEGVAFLGLMHKYAGLTLEETTELQRYSYLMKKDVEKISGQMMVQYAITGRKYKVLLNEKDVLKEIAKTSDYFKLTIEGGAVGLAKALATTKALGTSLETVRSTASGLLNFEDSIEKELHLELLIGKEINGEKLRNLALNMEHEKLAVAINDEMKKLGPLSENNAIAVEAMASFLNISSEKLAEIRSLNQSNVEASKESLTDEETKYQALVKAHTVQGALVILQMEALELQKKQANVAEAADAMMQNMIDSHLSEINDILTQAKKLLEDWGTKIDDFLSKIEIVKEAIAIMAGIIAGYLTMSIVSVITKMVIQLNNLFAQTREHRLKNQLLREELSTQSLIAAKLKEQQLTNKSITKSTKTQSKISKNIASSSSATSISKKSTDISTKSTALSEKGQTGTLAANTSVRQAGALAAFSTMASTTLGVAVPIIMGAIAAYMAYTSVKSMFESPPEEPDQMNDGIIGPGGNRVLYGASPNPISFNKKDTIVAGTKLMNDGVSYGSEGSMRLGNNKEIISSIKELEKGILTLASRPIIIEINGKKFIEATIGEYPNVFGLEVAKNSFQIN